MDDRAAKLNGVLINCETVGQQSIGFTSLPIEAIKLADEIDRSWKACVEQPSSAGLQEQYRQSVFLASSFLRYRIGGQPKQDPVMGCEHGRRPGTPCPHCLSMSERVLPNGWRWLKPGEFSKQGDYQCPRGADPIRVDLVFPIKMTQNHYPVMRKIEGDDEKFSCTDCGEDGVGVHACPGRPGKSQ